MTARTKFAQQSPLDFREGGSFSGVVVTAQECYTSPREFVEAILGDYDYLLQDYGFDEGCALCIDELTAIVQPCVVYYCVGRCEDLDGGHWHEVATRKNGTPSWKVDISDRFMEDAHKHEQAPAAGSRQGGTDAAQV